MSSETGKRNSDRVNMIGVVVVGICGAVLTYVSIVLLQAYYVNDTAQVETMADYGGQDLTARTLKTGQTGTIRPTQGVRNAGKNTFVIPIDRAIELVVEDAKRDPSNLVPSQGPATRPTVQPAYGRPVLLGQPAAPPAPPADAPAPPADAPAPPAAAPAPPAAAPAPPGVDAP